MLNICVQGVKLAGARLGSHTHIYRKNKMTQYVIAASEWLNFGGVVEFFRDLNRKLENRSRINATIKELSKLSDRELNDIGISRGDIWSIAHEDASFKRVADTNKNLQGWV